VDKLINAGHSILAKTYYLNYGREIIADWCKESTDITGNDTIRILDLGCGPAADLLNVKKTLPDKNLELFGIESYEPHVEQAKQSGINVLQLDIERQSIPVERDFFDIVIANQIIEHTKEIFWIFSEISRTLKKGGRVIVGVPNLLSMHNRVMMFFGQQPISIELLGPHVRGFTVPGFKKFVEADDYFKVLKIRGSNIYPFPPSASKLLSRLFPTFSVGLFFLIRRQIKEGNFIQVLDTRFYETPFYRGDC
jgi:SAM-dependent methyltransferase